MQFVGKFDTAPKYAEIDGDDGSYFLVPFSKVSYIKAVYKENCLDADCPDDEMLETIFLHMDNGHIFEDSDYPNQTELAWIYWSDPENEKIAKLYKDYWENFTSDTLKKFYNVMHELNKEENEKIKKLGWSKS